MPIDYKMYPANWLTELRPTILKRANNRCEHCGVQNHKTGYRTAKGKFIDWDSIENALNESGYDYFDDELSNIGEDMKPLKIVLTIAHLNQDVSDNRLENLAALCQRCHLNHDRRDNIYRRRLGKNYLNGLLFDKKTFDNLKIQI